MALIDWDLAAPGRRLDDVAHMCWQYPGLGPRRDGDVPRAARAVRILCDAYGLDDRSEVVGRILWWQERSAHGIDELADGGDPAMQRLRELGASRWVRESAAWVAANRQILERELH